MIVALADNGGPAGGNEQMVDLFIAGNGLLVIGLAAPAVSVATTVLTTRAPGMRMSRLPFFAWSALVASIGLLLVLPVVLGILVYLFVDHQNARALFGGNVGVGSWIGFALTQPATYLFALPAIGITAELIPPTFKRRMPMRGRRLHRARARRRRRPVRRHPADVPRAAVVRERARPRRLRPEVRRPPAVRPVHAGADPRRRHRAGARRAGGASPTAAACARTSRRPSCSRSSGSA